MMTIDPMESIAGLCKRRGFVFPSSEIYGGLAGAYDYGPLGVLLKKNIEKSWTRKFVDERDDMYMLDASILMSRRVWEASGHAEGFIDPLVEDVETHKRYRADHLLEEIGINPVGMSMESMTAALRDNKVLSPDGNALGDVRSFNMMLTTKVGASEDSSNETFLRPETAQGIFVNFKNVLDTMRPQLPFGIAQIGKAFRNEITPRNFLFRVREFDQMEIEYFVEPEKANDHFEYWRKEVMEWLLEVGLDPERIYEHEIEAEDRAHYSDRTIDFEFDFPFGRKELYGIANRTDYDLKKHAEASGQDITYADPHDQSKKFLPYIIEPSVGVGRILLAILVSSYRDEVLPNGEARTYLKFPVHLAPYTVAVSPLVKNKPELVEKAHHVYRVLKLAGLSVTWDDNGNIGKRYRRQDEIGTPFCVVIDFDTLTDNAVTIRDRDTMEQERVTLDSLEFFIKDKLNS